MGIFHDHDDKTFLYFARNVLAYSAFHTEILGIHKRLFIVAASHWSNTAIFIFEFDPHNVVKWFKEPNSASQIFQKSMIRECLSNFTQGIQFTEGIQRSIYHIQRSGNEATNVLEKDGSSRNEYIEFVWSQLIVSLVMYLKPFRFLSFFNKIFI